MSGLPSPSVFRGLEKLIANPAYQADNDSRETEEITEKFTGKVIGHVPRSTKEDTLAAIERARVAQKEWAKRSLKDRAAVLRRFAKITMAERENTADILQAETGKSRASALEEVLDTNVNARYYANHGPGLLKPKRVRGMLPVLTKTVILRKPKGVVGIVTPWNYPYTLAASDALPALLAGNAVVLNPASLTPYSAMRAAELLYQAGVPRDIFQVVTGRGSQVGDTIAHNADYLMFTGSSATGHKLGEIAGGRLISYSAELGGKNAMIVEKGANLKKAASVSMRGMFANAGQLCISIERVYVERDVMDEFLQHLKNRLDKLVIAANYEYSTEFGSIISEKQVQKIDGHVKDAVAKGAKVFYGGKRLPEIGPLYYSPTVLLDVPEGAEVRENETFGPVVSVYPVDSVEEAIERANDTEYGLNSSVWGKTYKSGELIASQLETGTVAVEEGYVSAWESLHAPMGGQGISGISHRHGPEGILKYTDTTTVGVQRLVDTDGNGILPHRIWQKYFMPIITRFFVQA
ncbi:MAG: succinic semialdehyde dehydrogenase [Lawsonella sp.]